MMHFVSLLHLDARACRQLKITDGYSLHRVVYSLFDDVRSEVQKSGSIPGGIQWVDKGGDIRGRRILIMSDRPPRQPTTGMLETKILPETYLTYQHYRFSVCLNPTKRSNQTGKLIPVTGRAAIAAWFCQRVAGWGFSVDPHHIQIESVSVLQIQKSADKTITQQQATLSGRLTVTEPNSFKKSVMQGIGRGRAFGCGLLQIVPLPDITFFD